MKSSLLAGALVVLTSYTAVFAQGLTNNQSAPFFLKVVAATNATLDGRYLYACHSGAAMETLCLGTEGTPTTNRHAATFYWNYTEYEGVASKEGALVWNLRLNNIDAKEYQIVSQPMTLDYFPFSNVAATQFRVSSSTSTCYLSSKIKTNPLCYQPSYPDGRIAIGFNNSEMYINTWIDDATFIPGTYPSPPPGSLYQLTNWHICWVLAGSYYYNALAWVTSSTPRNPTCQPVGVVKVDISD